MNDRILIFKENYKHNSPSPARLPRNFLPSVSCEMIRQKDTTLIRVIMFRPLQEPTQIIQIFCASLFLRQERRALTEAGDSPLKLPEPEGRDQ